MNNTTPNQTPIIVFDPNQPAKLDAPLILGGPKAAQPSAIIQANAAGRITVDPTIIPKQEQIVLQPFPDGSLFRFGPTGKADGSCVLVDANNQAVAIVKSAFIADFLCRGAHLFFVQLKEMQTQPPNEKNTPHIDDNLPSPGSAPVS